MQFWPCCLVQSCPFVAAGPSCIRAPASAGDTAQTALGQTVRYTSALFIVIIIYPIFHFWPNEYSCTVWQRNRILDAYVHPKTKVNIRTETKMVTNILAFKTDLEMASVSAGFIWRWKGCNLYSTDLSIITSRIITCVMEALYDDKHSQESSTSTCIVARQMPLYQSASLTILSCLEYNWNSSETWESKNRDITSKHGDKLETFFLYIN